MLTPYLPYPPASGGQIRTLNLLKYLHNNHDITLVCLYKNEEEKKYAQELEPYCSRIIICKRAERPWQPKNILKSVFTLLPFLIVRNYSSEARKIIEHLLQNEKFDVIHAETFYIMPHIPKTKIPILLVDQTIEFKVYQHFVSQFLEHFVSEMHQESGMHIRYKFRHLLVRVTLWSITHIPALVRLGLYIDILKLRYWETYYWRQATLVATVSKSDQDVIKQLTPRTPTTVIPNGAGDEMFVDHLEKKDLLKPKLLFVGNFYWLQNTEAALFLMQKIYPILLLALPHVEIVIAGQDALAKLPLDPLAHVRIIDLPPSNTALVRQLYQEATLFIAPIFGPGGTRLKILAAMAAGLPIISTSVGIQGLQVENNITACIAETPEQFTKSIVSILHDEPRYERIRKAAYHMVQSSYNWKNIAHSLETVYHQIIPTNANRN